MSRQFRIRRIVCVVLVLSAAMSLIANSAIAQTKKKRKVPKVFAPIKDDPKLPRVLIIGDSISIGYTLPTRALLASKANVHRIPTNGGPTIRGLKEIDKWLGDSKWDVIHFNWGLHDLRKDTASHQVPIDKYEVNMNQLVGRLKKTGAKLIWASTTPVPKGSGRRTQGDELAYNQVAAKIMKQYGVPTNDLHAFALSQLSEIQRPKNVHFTEPGSAILAKEVARHIEVALEK